MNKVIVYDDAEADGGIVIVTPAPRARRSILVRAEVKRDVFSEGTATNPDTGEDEIVRIKIGEEVLSPAEYRDETDDEFLARVAAKGVPEETAYRIMDADEAYAERARRVAS